MIKLVFRRRTGHHAQLLQIAGQGQSEAAADTADDQGLAAFGRGGLLLGRRSGGLLAAVYRVKDLNDHQQGQKTHKGTGGIEGVGPHMLGAGALGHEGGTPDHSGDDGEHYLANLVVFHSCFLSLFRIAFVGIYGVHMPAELVLRAVEQTMDIFSVAVDDQRRHDRAQKGQQRVMVKDEEG